MVRSIALLLAVLVWAAPAAAQRICVLVPHFKDEYWLSVGYGLEAEAALQGVLLMFFEAGGYRALQTQIDQLQGCVDAGASAVLIGAVSADHPDLLAAVRAASAGVPVFGLVNALEAPELAGRVGVDWREMGASVGRYLAARHPAGSGHKRAVLISGPLEAGWSAPLEAGLRAELARSDVALVAVLGADTGLREQLQLVESALNDGPRADYLVGSAPAIEAAMGHYAQEVQQAAPHPALIATYISHTIKRGLLNGQVLAVPFDDPMEQGRMALRMAIATLHGSEQPQSSGPHIRLLEARSDALRQINLSPADYFPKIEGGPEPRD